jgi:hypothetical protein
MSTKTTAETNTVIVSSCGRDCASVYSIRETGRPDQDEEMRQRKKSQSRLLTVYLFSPTCDGTTPDRADIVESSGKRQGSRSHNEDTAVIPDRQTSPCDFRPGRKEGRSPRAELSWRWLGCQNYT